MARFYRLFCIKYKNNPKLFNRMRFARIIYYIAGIYGIIALFPQYFMETKNGLDYPPPITHPEYYYGFVGIGLVFQFVFLLIARDPLKYRALMPITVLEKLSFGIPAIVLFTQNRLSSALFAAGIIDLILGALFVAAYLKTAAASEKNV